MKNCPASPGTLAQKMKLTLNIDVPFQRCLGFKTHIMFNLKEQVKTLSNESSYLGFL